MTEEDQIFANSVTSLRNVYWFGTFCVGTTASLLIAGNSIFTLTWYGFSSLHFMGFWLFAPMAFFMYVGACRTLSSIRISTAEQYEALSVAEFLAKQYRDQNIGLLLRLSMKEEQGAGEAVGDRGGCPGRH